MTLYRKLLKPAVWAFYIVIGLEFLFMISPFALYFYSSYGNLLNLLHRWSATAWLTGFFMPHVSMTASPLLNSLKPWGFRFAGLGILIFLLGVVQIYGAKLLRRGEVVGGLYRISRHPQYLALIVLSFGVLLIWPRFLVLVSFVTMLFLYLLLASWEEQQCLERYGQSYRDYMDRVGFFGPRQLTSWIPSFPLRGRSPLALSALYLLILVLAVGTGFGIRSWSLSQVSSFYEERTAVLSPALLDDRELRQAYRLAAEDPHVRAHLDELRELNQVVYVVPIGWYLPDLPLDEWEEIPAEHRGGHTTPRDFDRNEFKVLFTRALSHQPESRGQKIVETAYGREPVLRVRIDLRHSEVLAIESPPSSVVWGDIPTPLY